MTKIGGVSINEDYYAGEDLYSDGLIEEVILEYVKNKKNVKALLSSDSRWPILYHLSPKRHNLLEWYDFKPNENLLEIGSGCGAMTGLFAKKTKKVTCVELSKKRSLINAYRHENSTNIDIYLGNFFDVSLSENFNYITLIGVLEYAAGFIKSQNPTVDFIKKIKQYLKPSGQLIIAIENKFGLKYWSGAKEDHTGRLFDSIENYKDNRNISTFSKKELTNLLNSAGFQNIHYYYPFPDYKITDTIYSDSRLPLLGELRSNPNYDRDRMNFFDENVALDNIIANGDFSFFSNSFLVIARKGE